MLDTPTCFGGHRTLLAGCLAAPELTCRVLDTKCVRTVAEPQRVPLRRSSISARNPALPEATQKWLHAATIHFVPGPPAGEYCLHAVGTLANTSQDCSKRRDASGQKNSTSFWHGDTA
jgi:hypothetical protein